MFWVSEATGRYYTDQGLDRTLAPGNPRDKWFYDLVGSGTPYVLQIDKDVSANSYMLFINTRFDAGGGKRGIAGLGLSVDALAQAVRAYRVGESGSVFLVRGNGTILVHRDAALADGQHDLKSLPGFDTALAAALLGKERFAHAAYDAPTGRQLVASSYVPELDLYVIAELPEAQVLGQARRGIALTSAVAALVGGGIGLLVIVLVSRAIAAPVGRAARLLQEIADGDGDLSRRMPVETGDEVGALAEAFNRFVSSLESMVGAVRQAADSISVASSEVAQGNHDLSQRTEHTAGALQEAASSLAALTDSVQANTQATHSAGQLAQSARGVAERGGQAVQQVVETMEGINGSSRRIAGINTAIAGLDGATQQNSALVEESAAAAASLREQAQRLLGEVAAFKLREGGSQALRIGH